MPHRLAITDLSEREQQVLTLSTQGFTDKEIARELNLGLATVHTYWIRIKQKLGGVTRAEVVAAAVLRSAGDSISTVESEKAELLAEIRRRAKAEEELMRASQLLQAIIDATPDIVFVKTADGRYELVNKRFSEISGVSGEEAHGHTDHELFGEIGVQYAASDERVRKTEEPVENLDVVPVEGTKRYWSTIKFPILDDEGRLEFIAGITRDVTEDRSLAEELTRSREQLRLAFDAAGVIHWAWNIETGKVDWSEHTEALHGLAPGSFQGTFDAWKALVHQDDLGAVMSALDQAISTRSSYEVEFRTVRPDGALQWILGKGQVIADVDGKPTRMIGIATDITGLKQSEGFSAAREVYHELVHQLAGINHWEFDLEKNVLLLSNYSPHRRRIDANEASLERILEGLHPDDRHILVQSLETARRAGRYEARYRILGTDGGWSYRRSQGQVVNDASGQPTRLIGISMTEPTE